MSGEGLAITLNGEAREVPQGTTVAVLLEREGISTRLCAVEVSGAIVPKSLHGARALAEADRVEIVTFVGGG